MNPKDPFLTKDIIKILKDKTKTLKEKQLAFLNNTVEYYSQDPTRRGAEIRGDRGESYCLYRTEDNQNACAIGRFLTNENIENLTRHEILKYPINSIIRENTPKSKLIEKYLKDLNTCSKKGNAKFLSDVQYLHDFDDHWDERGLTDLGKKQVKKIKYKFELI